MEEKEGKKGRVKGEKVIEQKEKKRYKSQRKQRVSESERREEEREEIKVRRNNGRKGGTVSHSASETSALTDTQARAPLHSTMPVSGRWHVSCERERENRQVNEAGSGTEKGERESATEVARRG